MIDNHTAPEGSPFAPIVIGAVITRFGEVATRVHHGTFNTPRPAWFMPTQHENQGAAHKNGFSVYWQVTENEDAREAMHPFESEVANNAIHIVQLTLLG
jgi:hypothetical protein